MNLYLIRHAHAGDRHAEHHDRYRQLSDRGHKRAKKLVEILSDFEVDRVISSPGVRCVQTVEPLAASRGLEVEEAEGLWEDSLRADALKVMMEAAGQNVAICTHGNLIPEILDLLVDGGTKTKGRGCEKGSIWLLTWNGKRFKTATYYSRKASFDL